MTTQANPSKHSYPFQSRQLESNKYCKPKDFNTGPSQIREAAYRKMRDENDAVLGDNDPSKDVFRKKLDELVPNPSKVECNDLLAIEPAYGNLRDKYFPPDDTDSSSL